MIPMNILRRLPHRRKCRPTQLICINPDIHAMLSKYLLSNNIKTQRNNNNRRILILNPKLIANTGNLSQIFHTTMNHNTIRPSRSKCARTLQRIIHTLLKNHSKTITLCYLPFFRETGLSRSFKAFIYPINLSLLS